MKQPNPLPVLPINKRSQTDLAAMQALLDLYPGAVLLVNLKNNRIEMVNAQTIQLTAFTRAEISALKLDKLIPSLSKKFWLDKFEENEENKSVELGNLVINRHNTPTSEVYAIITLLDSEKSWGLLTLEPSQQHQQRLDEAQRASLLWEELRALAVTPLSVDASEALRTALEIASHLTGASLLAVYLAGSKNLELTLHTFYGCADKLPDRLNPEELASLRNPHLWLPKKRSISSLHRAGRAAGLAYLTSAPLGQANALVGLLVLASEQQAPADNLLEIAEIVASTVTTILQNQSLSENLQQKLNTSLRSAILNTAIQDNIQEGILVIAPDLTIVSLNPSAEAILGYASREVRGQPYQNLLVGAENLAPVFNAAQTVQSVQDLGNFYLYRRDGKSFLAHVRTMPILVDKQLECLVVLIQDVSQEQKSRLESQQLEQRAVLGELTASFAHDIRNPINNISTGLQLLGFNLPAEDANQEIVSRLRQDCDRLDGLMKSVLAFSKPMEYKMELLDLGQTLKRLLERWHPRLTRANIQHRLEVDSSTPLIEGDQRALEQVWGNLIGNALQAMEENGGTLTIKVHPVTSPDSTRKVEVIVCDTGVGIPEEYHDRIWESFFTTKRNGTGLGLAITKRIILTHKGTIQFTSIPGGTAFQVQLPVAEKL